MFELKKELWNKGGEIKKKKKKIGLSAEVYQMTLVLPSYTVSSILFKLDYLKLHRTQFLHSKNNNLTTKNLKLF